MSLQGDFTEVMSLTDEDFYELIRDEYLDPAVTPIASTTTYGLSNPGVYTPSSSVQAAVEQHDPTERHESLPLLDPSSMQDEDLSYIGTYSSPAAPFSSLSIDGDQEQPRISFVEPVQQSIMASEEAPSTFFPWTYVSDMSHYPLPNATSSNMALDVHGPQDSSIMPLQVNVGNGMAHVPGNQEDFGGALNLWQYKPNVPALVDHTRLIGIDPNRTVYLAQNAAGAPQYANLALRSSSASNCPYSMAHNTQFQATAHNPDPGQNNQNNHPIVTQRKHPELERSRGASLNTQALQARLHQPKRTRTTQLPGHSARQFSHVAINQRRGGRHGPLRAEARSFTKAMRDTKACWACAIQRDSCDHDEECARCELRAYKGVPHPLGCNRTSLGELTRYFLAAKMAETHKRDVVDRYVKDNVCSWLPTMGQAPTIVPLTVGYGPPLQWPMYLFRPKNPEVVRQMIWKKGDDGKMKLTINTSLPLGLKPFRTEELRKASSLLEHFVDTLVTNHLDDFQTLYAEDHKEDPFRLGILHFSCQLLESVKWCSDNVLRDNLRLVFRLLVIRDIMSYPLVVHEDYRSDLISQIYGPMADDNYPKAICPKLANRQLKSILSRARKQACQDVLDRLHKIIRTTKGKSKDNCWLSSFVLVTLTAIFVEDSKDARILRAYGDAERKEQEFDEAIREAERDCEGADHDFAFLVNLFNCKYAKKRGTHKANFADWEEQAGTIAELEFLRNIRNLVKEHCKFYTSTRICIWKPLMRSAVYRPSNSSTPRNESHKSGLLAQFLLDFVGPA